MVHPEYRRFGTPLDRIIEEAAEVIKAASKIKRFGVHSTNPFVINGPTNAQRLAAEMKDLSIAYEDWKKER